jgi:uncharacterized membrane protein YheB (UPF0754 family)
MKLLKMEKEEIEKGNRLVADFMNLAHDIEGRISFLYTMGEEFPYSERICTEELIEDEIIQEIDEFGSNLMSETYSFHTSWDWLIPVVAKIVNELPQFDNETKTEKVLQALLSANIYEVYNSVIQFITWYNEQNNSLENGNKD